MNLVKEKLREAELGFDGSWVVHPLLVDTGRKCFQTVIMSAVNQKHKLADYKPDWQLYPFVNSRVGEDFGLAVDKKDIKRSVRVCLIYYFHWLKGSGAVAFDNLMEVSSTVEVCRVLLWVWLH